MTLTTGDAWVMATAAACAGACAIPGCFLVLRRMSLLGDAISHAVLPGIAVAFILSGTRDPVWMLAGAAAAGLLTAILSTTATRLGRVDGDASLGVVFTSFFAIGVLLITWFARNVDLDPGCVLYGAIELAPLDRVAVLGMDLPRSFVFLGSVAAINAILVTIFRKELTLACFDPELATAMGFSAAAIQYGLFAMTAATSVAAFEAVGSVLVVSMLAAPAATAFLLTDRLWRMVGIALIVGVGSAVVGTIAAVWIDTSVSGCIAATQGLAFVLAAVLSPRHGILAKIIVRLSLSLRITRDDVLGMLYRWEEAPVSHDALSVAHVSEALDSRILTRLSVRSLRTDQSVTIDGTGGLRLTERGRDAASKLVRAHRLWELYLAERLRLPLDHVHEPSDRAEHFISEGLTEEIARDIQRQAGLARKPDVDPHGKAIPK